MERQLKYFFDFLENDKKLSDNTLQSYKIYMLYQTILKDI